MVKRFFLLIYQFERKPSSKRRERNIKMLVDGNCISLNDKYALFKARNSHFIYRSYR